MKPRIFLDCGYYVGKALEYYAPLMDKDWVVYAFEPNTELNVDETSKRFPFKVGWVKKAVWTEDGKLEFAVANRDDASHISQLRTNTDKRITVPCVDFSRFVDELPTDSTIVCSMDIEGAEFPILEKMLEENTIDKIDLLDIEFHDRLFDDKSAEDSSNLRKAIESRKVLVKLKI